jgi:hypothetical protein
MRRSVPSRRLSGIPSTCRAATAKNLFLKGKKGKLWLLICLNQRRIDLNRLAKELGCARLSFGKADLLEAVLGVAPRGGCSRCWTAPCWSTRSSTTIH